MRLSGPNLLAIHQLRTIKIFYRLPKILQVLILHSDVVHRDDHGCVYIFYVGVPLELFCLGVDVPSVRPGIPRFGLPELHQDLLAALQAAAGILYGFPVSIEILLLKTYFFRAESIAQMLSMVPAMFMVSELFSISNCKAF